MHHSPLWMNPGDPLLVCHYAASLCIAMYHKYSQNLQGVIQSLFLYCRNNCRLLQNERFPPLHRFP